MDFKRNYRYKGINPDKEQRNFWIWIIIGIAIGAILLYLL